MRALLLMTLFAVPAFAAEDDCEPVTVCNAALGADGPSCYTVRVCDPVLAKKQAHKKKVAHKAKKPAPTPPAAEAPALVDEVPVAPSSYQLIQVQAPSCPLPAQGTVVTKKESPPVLLVGPHGALSFGYGTPNVWGLLGLRAELSWFGLEAYSLFTYGWGAQALFYPYRGERLNIDLTLGALAWGDYVSVKDIPRTWDVTAGAGLEYLFREHLALTVDWRATAPNPFYVVAHDKPVFDASGAQVYGEAGKYLDVKHVVKNALTQSQILVGLMVRF